MVNGFESMCNWRITKSRNRNYSAMILVVTVWQNLFMLRSHRTLALHEQARKSKALQLGYWSPYLGGGFKHFLFLPQSLGKWSNLTNIFQMGWNHQLEQQSHQCDMIFSSLQGNFGAQCSSGWRVSWSLDLPHGQEIKGRPRGGVAQSILTRLSVWGCCFATTVKTF